MTNLEKYRSVLSDDLDGILLTSRYNRAYGAQFDIAEGYAIIGRSGARYFTDSRYIESAENNIKNFDVIMFSAIQNPLSDVLTKAIVDFDIQKLGFEESYLTVGEFEDLKNKINAKIEFVPVQSKLNVFREAKEQYELDLMIKAQEITDKAFAEVCPRIKEGMTEKELNAELIYCLYKNGADGLAFDPIVVAGPNTSMPHGVPGERKIQKGDFITMDFGALYQGYCADMTRTVALGFATDEMKDVYYTVLKAQTTAINASKAGIIGKELDGIARKVIVDAGYGEYFGHGYGHGVGLEIHEAPNASVRSNTAITAGACVSAEPGIYLPGKFGVRIEDVVLFTEDGFIDITMSPKDLIIL